MNTKFAVGLVAILTGLPVLEVFAQPTHASRMITVAGVPVRVSTAGLDRRVAGQPVIVLEAGSGADLETWKPVFTDLAAIGPVAAYDRLGLGQSGADPKTPTLTRNVETLHDVLHGLAPPPYVLVGHSADTPAGLRPVYEQLLAEMRDDFPSARPWRQPQGIPVGVIVTARSDRLRGNGGALVRLQIKHQMEWTLGSANGIFAIAGYTGHQVHRDDPALVVSIVRHVFERATAKK